LQNSGINRSISDNSRTIFEYFIGHKLGLTATPKDYLKNLFQKNIEETDPREMGRCNLLSTYKTFFAAMSFEVASERLLVYCPTPGGLVPDSFPFSSIPR
jgi:hypothetical protein